MLFDVIRQEIFHHIARSLASPDGTTPEIVLEVPPDSKMGDFAFPAFKLAKTLKKAPPAISKELVEKLSAIPALTKLCSISALGPYVNFTVHREVILGDVLHSLLQPSEQIAERRVPNPATVILEFSSPNVAKAFNIYHLRGTMIGNCLDRIFKIRGYKTISINHLGDWGTQYGTLALAYEKWGDETELQNRGIEYLVELYVRINKEIESNPSLKDQGREYFARLERGEPTIKKVWEKFVDLSIGEFKKTYARLNVDFDHYWGESTYISQVPALEKKLESLGLLEESQGAQIVNLEKFGMPPCIVRKQDGSTIYATRDLAAAIYRYEQFHFSKCVYVVGGEQKLHFAQFFKVLELMNYPWANQCVHVDFGLYRFNDAKMSTRKGNFVTMEAVLDQAVDRVKQIMAEKNAQMPEAERNAAAEIIGVGAIVYNDLSTDRNTDVNFDLERVLDFEGETGPYIQYAHTRCLGILRNAPKTLIDKLDTSGQYLDLTTAAHDKLKENEELDLIRTLAKLPLILDTVLETYRPSHLATYLITITKAFNQFYRSHKVLVEDQDLARARLALVIATQRTLLQGLTLLGMRVPERM